MIYRIRDWDRHFETHDTRKMKRLAWVPIPNKHDGLGYRLLLQQPNGFQHYAAWLLIVQVASKCPNRGTLADDTGNGLTAEALAAKTGAPANVFAKAFAALVEVGWLEAVAENLPVRREILPESPGTPGDSPGAPGDSPGRIEGKGKEGNRTEQKELTASSETANGSGSKPTPAVLTFETVGKDKSWDLTQEQVDEWRAAYPGLDILGECRKALAWTKAKQKKTAKGMPAFLVNWFGRAVNQSPCARNDALFGGSRRGKGASTFEGLPGVHVE